jgi:hypothetical protein
MPFLSNDRLDPAQSHGDLLLAFVSYQRSLTNGFLTVQARLKGEPP